MYTPSHFAETRRAVLHGLMDAHPLGMLVTSGPAGLDANHIPFEISAAPEDGPHGTLRAHVARANPLWREHPRELEALVVFQGPQAYISPTWYVESKPASGRVVPTWNYCVVHARGPLQAIEDPDWLRGQLTRLVRRHEAAQAKPWHLADAPDDFIAKQITAIVGLEIRLTQLAGKWKVSQNRSAADRAGVVAGLEGHGGDEARAMARLVPPPEPPPE